MGRNARWPNNKNTQSTRRQNPDDPQPRTPAGRTQRGGKQSAEELKAPPTRPGRNGGTLRSGGTNKGGNGATPSVLRSRCRDTLAIDKIFNVPYKIIRDPGATWKEKLDAWKALAQFGGLGSVSLTDNDGNPLELPPFVVEIMTREQRAAMRGDTDEESTDETRSTSEEATA